jgi:uncharacterized protein YejL (UPF0352 family)
MADPQGNTPETKQAEQQKPFFSSEKAGTLLPLKNGESGKQVAELADQVSAFLSELPEILTKFFSEYQRPLLTIGLIITALITVKITLAVLDAVNDIPLLAPIFELIGIGYSGWFIYRYLLRASTRKELVTEVDNIKAQFLGKDS